MQKTEGPLPRSAGGLHVLLLVAFVGFLAAMGQSKLEQPSSNVYDELVSPGRYVVCEPDLRPFIALTRGQAARRWSQARQRRHPRRVACAAHLSVAAAPGDFGTSLSDDELQGFLFSRAVPEAEYLQKACSARLATRRGVDTGADRDPELSVEQIFVVVLQNEHQST